MSEATISPPDFVPVDADLSLPTQMDEWDEIFDRVVGEPSTANIRDACYSSGQVWQSYFSAAAPFGTPPPRLAKVGQKLLRAFNEVVTLIDGLPAETRQLVLGYREKFLERAHFVDTLLRIGTAAVLLKLDESIERNLAARAS